MAKFNSFLNREEFSQRYLKPLLIDPLQARLDALPDFAHSLPPTARVDAQGGNRQPLELPGGIFCRPCFARTAQGWTWRDHVLLAWRTDGVVSHRRESEQECRYEVVLSDQLDSAGVERPTIDINATLMRYERDAVTQLDSAGQPCDLGKGWARATLQWSLRLQLIVMADGRANVITRVRRNGPVTDAGRAGGYVVSDPLTHLLNVPRLAQGWEHGPAGLVTVQEQLVSRLAAAIEPTLAHHEYV
jgi:hypothetical protein